MATMPLVTDTFFIYDLDSSYFVVRDVSLMKPLLPKCIDQDKWPTPDWGQEVSTIVENTSHMCVI